MGYQRTAQSKTAVTDTSKKSVTSPPPVWASPSQSHPLLQLQQKIGNRAVSQLIQAKLKVGKPNDTYEQEADRVADTVMRLSEPTIQRQEEEKKEETVQTKPIAPITPLIQRQATEEKKEETAQAKGVADTPEVTPHLETRIQTMRGSGQPLPEATRTFFESRFGYDLGGVRVHTDSQADEASRSLNAQAFTIGQNVFFAGGRYEPQTNQGKWLLAHELTHTLQQQPPNPLAARKSTANTPRVSHSPTPLISQKAAATQDSGLKAVVERAKGVAKQKKQHAPAKTKAAQAQAAAKSPPNEVASKASANQVQQMDASQPKPFNRNAFKAALLAKIAAATPKNLKEADEFKESGKVSSIKGDLTPQVDTGKKQSQGAVEAKVKAPPDTSGIPPRTATPLPPAETAAPPGNIDAAQAAPKPKSAADVSLQEGSQSLDQKLGEADVTEDQLKKSNEPEFQAAAEAKKQAQKDAVTAPQAYRQSEQAIVTQAQVEATATAQTQLQGMQGVRGQMLNRVQGSQQQTQSKDEQERAKVATEIQATYNRTKQKAEERLTRLDTEVNQAFDEGATAAQQAFEDDVERRMNAYKDERYSVVIIGAGRWVKDQFLGMPHEVNVFYTKGKNLYLQKMDAVLDRIAGIVETGLNEAKAEIAKGRKEVQDYVNQQQPANLKQAAQEAGQNIQSQFDQLEQKVNDKQNQLINSLAQKYNENLQKIDSRIEKMKAKNRGLVDAALDAVGGVIKTILKLKDMLLGVLARVAEVVGHIIKHPIDFLGNLVAGVKQGFMNFVGNIGTHLQKGLMGWLFGAMAEAGIQLPESFDLKGILSLVFQVLGLTFGAIRARAVKILGEPIVKALETASEIFQILITQGPGGLWEYDLQDVVIEGIKSFVEESIIKAGVTWILGLLNPAGAFIKACKAIYDIVMFFVERGSQILALVNAIIDSMAAIASGAIGVAASAVENALSKAIPVAIAFLAALLGVTGITDKIRSIIAKVQAPVSKAIDWVIDKAYNLVKAAGKLLGFGKGKEGEKAKSDKDHEVLAQQVIAELQKTDQEPEDFDALKSEKEAKARRIEQAYVAKLDPGIKLTVNFSDAHKDEEELDFEVVIAPNTTSKKAKVKIDSKLKEAIDSVGIVEFMRAMAGGKKIQKISRSKFEKLWNIQANKDFVKARFRAANTGHHEWIPSNMIMQAINRAAGVEDGVEIGNWIDVQHELRTDTSWVIFNLSKSITKKYGREKKDYTVLQGHVGALYLDGTEQTQGTGAFHDASRKAFNASKNIKDCVSEVQDVFEDWVWDGKGNPSPPLHPKLTWNGMPAAANLSKLKSQQSANFDATKRMFASVKRKASRKT
jgi:hypothetical protein